MGTIAEVERSVQSGEVYESAKTQKKTANYGRTIGAPELSEKAQKYYEELKKKYSNMDFVLVSNDMKEMRERNGEYWEVPYLPIDPSDIGREYEPIVRINSQSGKGGVAFIMDTYFGFKLPKGMHKEFANVIQNISEHQGEVAPDQIMDAFREEYLNKKEPVHFRKLHVVDLSGETKSQFDTKVIVIYTDHGVEKSFEAVGNGPIDAAKRGLAEALDIDIKILDYEEHALQSGSNSQAAAYIHLLDSDTGRVTYGVGVSSNITRASVRAIFSAVNRLELGGKCEA